MIHARILLENVIRDMRAEIMWYVCVKCPFPFYPHKSLALVFCVALEDVQQGGRKRRRMRATQDKIVREMHEHEYMTAMFTADSMILVLMLVYVTVRTNII